MRTAVCVTILTACLSTLATIPRTASAQTPPGADGRMPGEITNSIGMKFVLIPAGEFLMGSKQSVEEVYEQFPGGPEDTSYYKAEHPQHKVRITRPFYMGVHEVTVGEYEKFVATTSYKTAAETGAPSEGFELENGGYSLGLGESNTWERIKGLSWRNPGFPQTDGHPVV